MDLPPKQAAFVAEYLVDLNATQAYIRAGYSEKGAAQSARRLLRNAQVSAAVAAGKKERAERLAMTADDVLADLVEIKQRCLQAEPVLIFVEGEWVESGEYRFDASGAIKALDLIGRHVGCGWSKIKVEGDVKAELGLRVDAVAIARAMHAQRRAEANAAEGVTTTAPPEG